VRRRLDDGIYAVRAAGDLVCAVCQKPIHTPGADGLPISTRGVREAWCHHGACLEQWTVWHVAPKPVMDRGRVLDLFERARAAGRLIEPER
jgi:hypothetical protein